MGEDRKTRIPACWRFLHSIGEDCKTHIPPRQRFSHPDVCSRAGWAFSSCLVSLGVALIVPLVFQSVFVDPPLPQRIAFTNAIQAVLGK